MSGDVETDNWESTVSQMVKKMLDTVVAVDARASFSDDEPTVQGLFRNKAEAIFSFMGIKSEEFLRNVYRTGDSLELHFTSIFKRDVFLDKFTSLLVDSDSCELAVRCHPMARRNGQWPFLRIGDLRRTREIVKRRRDSSSDGERNDSNISDFFHAIENILETFMEEVLSEERFQNDVSSFAAQGVKN
ncbi:hypothetical protein ANCCAN_07973 [Ancylostoma caninum]|uniref:Uncharacterized protein n=1 Tax=Ancylostoma caninum TaxID=29170 RepID=A0A368GNT5_ANCCA|nr:hypothetical protein ANCCAN_07973 [Ancylostoma caninum]